MNDIVERKGAASEPMELEVSDVVRQVDKIAELMHSVLKQGLHYGVIPGTLKPTLYKAGAEKICALFRLGAGEPAIELVELADDHRDYRVVIPMIHLPTGRVVTYGVGSCSTRETKYRYRKAFRVCPLCGSDAIIKGRDEYGGGWLCYAKKGGCGAKFPDGSPAIEDQPAGRVENLDIADAYNTCLKMAMKRAYVEGTIKATAASDFFTQDVEDALPPDAEPPNMSPPPPPLPEPKQPPRDHATKSDDDLIVVNEHVEAARRRVLDHLHALVSDKIYTPSDAREIEQKANRMSVLVPASALAELAKLYASLPKLGATVPSLDDVADQAWPGATLQDSVMDPSDEPPSVETDELF